MEKDVRNGVILSVDFAMAKKICAIVVHVYMMTFHAHAEKLKAYVSMYKDIPDTIKLWAPISSLMS